MPKRLSDTHRRIFELADQGMPNVQIARSLACNRSHISRTLRNAELRVSWESEQKVGTVVAGDSHLQLLEQARNARLALECTNHLREAGEMLMRRIQQEDVSLDQLLRVLPVLMATVEKVHTVMRLNANMPSSIVERRELRADVDTAAKLRDALRELDAQRNEIEASPSE